MKFFQFAKDGGAQSHVTGFFFIEIKPLFSVVLLHFRNGTREAFHSHAFNAVTWARTWREYLPGERRFVTLTHGRKVVREN